VTLPGHLSPTERRRFHREVESRLALRLLGFASSDRLSKPASFAMADSSCRGRGSCIWWSKKARPVGVNPTAFFSPLALVSLQSWKSRYGTLLRRGRSSMVFIAGLWRRFFLHLCGKSPHASLLECLTVLSSAWRSQSCVRRSAKYVLKNLE